jgi:outer membrane lipoprotein-sorting protein
MSGTPQDQGEDLLKRAIAATRELPVPAGPSTDLASQTLAALRGSLRQPKTTFYERINDMSWTSKASAAVAVAASVLVMYVVLSNAAGGARAFAAVAEALKSVRSATWKTTTVAKGGQNETITSSSVAMFLAPSHERMETDFQGAKSIHIMDGQKDKVIVLVPATKTAMVIDLKNLPPDRGSPFGNTFQELRKLVSEAQSGAQKAERLGVETIDGRRAEGFRIQTGAHEVKIWSDAETLLPVRVEQNTTGAAAGPEGHTVMTDFRVDLDLDESLFALEVPEGYTLQQTVQLDVSKNPIYHLADMLKLAAELNNGVFPSSLHGEDGLDGILKRSAQEFGKKMAERIAQQPGKNAQDQLREATMELSMKLGGTFGFLVALSTDQNDWHYAGKDVKLNTSDRPIFWYKRNSASTTYQVLYADLSVKEVPADEAPKVPPSEGSPKK